MCNTGTLGIAGRAADEAVESGNDAGTNVDTHDDGIHAGKIHGTGCGQRLQHRDRCGGTLHDDRDHKASKDAQQRRLGEAGQELNEQGRVRKTLDCTGHIHQTHEEDTKTDADIADGLGLVALDEHDQDDARKQSDGGKGICIKQPQQPVIAGLHEGQVGQPGSDGSTNVSTVDDGNGLLQVQDTGTDQSNGQNDCGSGTLDDSRNHSTGQNTHEDISCHLLQHALECFAGTVLKAVTHDFNAIEEHRQTAEHLDNRT